MVSKFIQIGNKAELYLMRQIEREEKTGERVHVYHSQVTDIYEDSGIEFYMPTEAGKAVLFPLRIRLSVLFDTQSGWYRGIGLVEERYRSNNRYMLRVGLKSPLYKHHMHTYSSMACTIDMAYFAITSEQALKTPELQLQKILNAQKHRTAQKRGLVIELCGAGIRFLTDTESEANSYILVQMQHKLVPAYLVSSERSLTDSRRFENRAEFIWKDSKVQEDLLRFVFEKKKLI